MAIDIHRIFHETWIGEAQPSEGLTFSVPVLCDGGVMQRLGAAQAHEFATYAVTPEPDADADDDTPSPQAHLADLRAGLLGFFGWTEDELHGPDRLPDDLVLRLAEEGTELRPTLAIPHGDRARATQPAAPPAARVLPTRCQKCGTTRHHAAQRPPQNAPICENPAGRRKGGGLRGEQ